jgi:multimeric flavodoxin WrbA
LEELLVLNILGLCGGRRLGNSEILVKEALMGAEETGAAVDVIRLMDLTIAGVSMLNRPELLQG